MDHTRSYRNHNMVQRYCRHIDANVVVMRDDDLEPDEYECLTPQMCGRNTSCRRLRKVTEDVTEPKQFTD